MDSVIERSVHGPHVFFDVPDRRIDQAGEMVLQWQGYGLAVSLVFLSRLDIIPPRVPAWWCNLPNDERRSEKWLFGIYRRSPR